MTNTAYILNTADLQKFREEEHRSLDFRLDKLLANCRVIEILPDGKKIEWIGSAESLIIFYTLLKRHGYINCEWDFFKVHFIGTEPTLYKILFCANTTELPYIIDYMRAEGFIGNCKHPHLLLAGHFLDKWGNPINNRILRQLQYKGVGKKREQFIEEEIIKPMIKNKLQNS